MVVISLHKIQNLSQLLFCRQAEVLLELDLVKLKLSDHVIRALSLASFFYGIIGCTQNLCLRFFPPIFNRQQNHSVGSLLICYQF